MQSQTPHWKLLLCFLILSQAKGQDARVKQILESSPQGLSSANARSKAVVALKELSTARRTEALERAGSLGLATDWTDSNGRMRSLVRFDGDRPRYYITANANAAISTGANLLQVSPYTLSGTGFTFGLWDGGTARTGHQELSGRVTLKDSASPIDHATHVGGTLAATGVKLSAKGMAPSARIDSYDWLDDTSEMTDRGATYPGEPGKLYISNHSYGFISGYDQIGAKEWNWWGNGLSVGSIEQDFGRYDDDASGDDALAYNAPYFLMFRAAGNDRNDNPVSGDLIHFGSTTITYNSSTSPKGDGTYRGGFENIAANALAKNLMTVGSVDDAVTSGLRDTTKATMSSYSCWGPTDDGRIKPDVVANGEEVYSCIATGNADYESLSGTSMASPNAAGSSMLLVQLYSKLYPGQFMRASTLKGLVIHTCDDLGNAGPDYKFGWGLVNVKAAADLLLDQSANPGKNRLSENALNSTITSRTETFTWDGTSPIVATLSWTDPAGQATSTSDDRSPRLVNDLNLHLVGPDGTIYRPFVMPFVGTWTQESMNQPATTGINTTDNVEKVLISSPTQAGEYQVVVDYAGTLSTPTSSSGGSQTYSLILTGATSKAMPAPTLTSYTPLVLSGGANENTFTAIGTGFHTGASVKLTRAGSSPVAISGLQVTGELIKGVLDSVSLTTGVWDLTITNPDGQSVSIPAALTVDGSLWAENFETSSAGWTHNATVSDLWTYSSTNPRSGTKCFRSSAPSSANVNNLISPLIPIPGNGTQLVFGFYQACLFTTGDAGVLEISSDNGTTWVDITAPNSGATVVQGGYDGKIPSGTGNTLAGRFGWMGTSGNYTQTSLALDTATFAGKNLRLRWRLSSNSSVPSNGAWSIDDLSLSGKLTTIPYLDWAATYFPGVDPDDFSVQDEGDADGDGLSNFLEYAMGTSPLVSDAGQLLVKNADGSITLKFTRSLTAVGITPHAETSSDMITWTEVAITNQGSVATTPVIQNMQATLPGGQGRKFIRIRFSR